MRLVWLPLCFLCAAAQAATLSGKISDSGGAGVQAPEVRLWAKSGKGYSFSATGGQVVAAAADGSFTFSNVPAGTWLVDVRPGVGFTDRWFDTDGNGYVQADADVITTNAVTVKANVDITVEASSGLDGTAKLLGNLAAGLQVRVEQTGDPRIHHNMDSLNAEHQGEYAMRSMPPGTYRVLIHDPSGVNEDQFTPSPVTLATGMTPTAPALDLVAAPNDATEPNNSRATATPFTTTRTTPYNAPGSARIAPKSGDIDWYCTTANTGERFVARAIGMVTYEGGGSHESPWVDPVISAWTTNDAGTYFKLAEDDDSGPLTSDALVDTGELPKGGPLCFAVTTYGDTGYTGTNQGSAGPYAFNVQFANRGPTVTVTRNSAPVPQTVTMNEGDLLSIDLTYSDPENDTILASWNLVGASTAVASAGSFNTSTGMSTFLWRAPQTAARDSPYVLTLLVRDPEIVRTTVITVVVNAVNVAPTTPVLLSPIDGGHIATQVPALTCRESFDPDEESLSYDYEVYYGSDGGTVAQQATLDGVDGGWRADAGAVPNVVFDVTPIPENTFVRWRARAYDGHPANGHSPWSGFGVFVVDSANDPPVAPVLVKPADAEVVLTRRPALSAAPGLDPEGDAFSLYFEVALDSAFTMPLTASGPLAVSAGPTTMWTVDVDLDWGTQYFARAYALDIRNGKSAYSNVNGFMVRENAPPTVPPFISPDEMTCMSDFVASSPGHVLIGNATDVEGDAISIQLRIFAASADPSSATPLFDATKAQTPTQTEFDVSAVELPRDVKHRVQARSVDVFGHSAWSECLFTVGKRPGEEDAGAGGGAGGGGGGTMTKGGCHCSSTEGLLALAALGLLVRRRRTA